MTTTPHLLVVSVGPVQDFIARARRTRDLWFGSFLLSKVAKDIARNIADQKGELIFPANYPGSEKQAIPLMLQPGIGNVVLAYLPATLTPQAIAQTAKQHALDQWKQLAQDAYDNICSPIVRTQEAWQAQVDDAIECYAAWVSLPDEANYRDQRRRLMHLLSGRKSCRDFSPCTDPDTGLPKSSLDGARETVLKKPSDIQCVLYQDKYKHLRHRLRLNRNEQLSAIDLVKRSATNESFPSVTRVAIDPWLRRIQSSGDEQALANIKTIKETAQKVTGSYAYKSPYFQDQGIYEFFPYDAQWLLPNRIATLLREKESEEYIAYTQEDKHSFTTINNTLQSLIKKCGQPTSYLAILAADGDKMGEVLSACTCRQQHSALSEALYTFSEYAHKTIRETYHGVCIFAGGEDVLALLPLDQALQCADTLRQEYTRRMSTVCQEKDIKDRLKQQPIAPTLSVGIAIAHCLEPLEDLRSWAQAAEQTAKNKAGTDKGNALTVHYYPHSGVPMVLRENWETPFSLVRRLILWQTLLQHKELPGGLAFALETLAGEYSVSGAGLNTRGGRTSQCAWSCAETARNALQAEIEHIMFQKKLLPSTKEDIKGALSTVFGAAANNAPQAAVLHLAAEIRLARLLAAQTGAAI